MDPGVWIQKKWALCLRVASFFLADCDCVPFPQTRSSRNDLHNHHSEIFRSILLFEDIMDSSSGKLQEPSL
jgi:hypothetical protein